MPTATRRKLMKCVAVSLAAVGPSAHAQVPGTSKRIAFLSAGTPATSDGYSYGRFSAALKALGWTEGINLSIEKRYVEGDPSRVPALTKELLASKPDIFVSSVDLYARSAAQASKTLPIVFVLGFDPVALGIVESLARPGGNVTGFSVLNYELSGKRLSLFKQALPQMGKTGVLYRDGDGKSTAVLDALRVSGKGIGIEIIPIPIRGRDDLSPAIVKAVQMGVAGVMNVPDPLFFTERKFIADVCLAHRLAASFGAAEFADAGMLLGYGTDFGAMSARAATLVDRILRGASPATIPVEQASAYELVVNLKTARALGIEIPKSLVLQATRLIN